MNILAIDLDQTLLHTDKTVSAYTQAIFQRVGADCRITWLEGP